MEGNILKSFATHRAHFGLFGGTGVTRAHMDTQLASAFEILPTILKQFGCTD